MAPLLESNKSQCREGSFLNVKIPVWLEMTSPTFTQCLLCTVLGSSAALTRLPLAGPQTLAHRQAGVCQGR